MEHTQSAGGVVVNKRGQVLVVNQNGSSWSLPKGHIEPGEDALAAAKREICEESGVTDLELVRELGSYKRHRIGLHGGEDRSEMKTICMFLFRTGQEGLRLPDPKIPEAKWMEKGKVAGMLTHKKDREFFMGIIDKI